MKTKEYVLKITSMIPGVWYIGNEVYGSWETGYEADGAEYGKQDVQLP